MGRATRAFGLASAIAARCVSRRRSATVSRRSAAAPAPTAGCAGAVVVMAEMGGIKFLQGEDALTSYRFHTGSAQHFFCSRCGIYTHHQRRSDQSLYAVNVACLDGVSPFDFPRCLSWMASIIPMTPASQRVEPALSASSRLTDDRCRPDDRSAILSLRSQPSPHLVQALLPWNDGAVSTRRR